MWYDFGRYNWKNVIFLNYIFLTPNVVFRLMSFLILENDKMMDSSNCTIIQFVSLSNLCESAYIQIE